MFKLTQSNVREIMMSMINTRIKNCDYSPYLPLFEKLKDCDVGPNYENDNIDWDKNTYKTLRMCDF